MENQKENKTLEKEQLIILSNKQNLSVSGTNKIISLKNDLIQLDTINGLLQVFGNNLELIKLDNATTRAEVSGEINTIKFSNEKSKEPFFRKIFK